MYRQALILSALLPIILSSQCLAQNGEVPANRTVALQTSQANTASNNLSTVATRAALAARTGLAAGVVAFLTESGREGIFVWTPGDFTAAVARDAPKGVYGQGLYVAPARDPSGASGAWMRKYDGPINVQWFGAKGIGNSFDDSPAFRAALASTEIYNATTQKRNIHGIIFVPKTSQYYYFASTLELTHSVALQGEGGTSSEAYSATIIKTPAGVTAIYNTTGPHPRSGGGMQIRDIFFGALGHLTGTGTVTNYTPGSFTVTLASPTDTNGAPWQNGQLILIRGVGPSYWHQDPRVDINQGTTTAGANTLTFSGRGTRIVPGTVIDIEGAGLPVGTRIATRVNDNNYTLTQKAANNATAGVRCWEDLAAMVRSGGGTAILVLSDTSARGIRPLANAHIEHYDSGIYNEAGSILHNVSFDGFRAGAGVFYTGNTGMENSYGRQVNTNQSKQTGRLDSWNNRNGLRVTGSDANVIEFMGYDGGGNLEWSVTDGSGLGNSYYSAHTSGTYGYQTTRDGARTNFYGCYKENNTGASFAAGTSIFGGFIGSSADRLGGWHIHNGGDGNVRIGPLSLFPSGYPYNLHMAARAPGYGLFRYDMAQRDGVGDNEFNVFAWSEDRFPGQNDKLLLMHDFDGKVPIAFSRKYAAPGGGQVLLPNGYYLGNGTGIEQDRFRKRILGTAAPTTGDWIRGDVIENRDPASGGYMGWVCTASGAPGTWKRYGLIE